MEKFTAFGLMSGTSMDGIDVAAIHTDGESEVKSLGSLYIPYCKEFQQLLKLTEYVILQYKGEICLRSEKFFLKGNEYLSNEIQLNQSQINSWWNFFPQMNQHKPLEWVIEQSTWQHIKALQALIKQLNLPKGERQIIGYHGQTFYHKPKQGLSIQSGFASLMAQQMHMDVIYDFRQNDIQAGGQGAPLAPVYHQALCHKQALQPAIVVNCGGITNLTYIHGQKLCAFDVGPGNGLLDKFIRHKTAGEYSMDTNGRFSANGQVDEAMIELLWQQVCVPEGENFFAKDYPKSLDINDLKLPSAIHHLNLEDGAATLAYFSAYCLAKAKALLPHQIDAHWILSGGGWKNPSIFKYLKQFLAPSKQVFLADELGWNNQGLEAELFAYLAVRSLKGKAISFPETTGVPKPISGGQLVKANKNLTFS